MGGYTPPPIQEQSGEIMQTLIRDLPQYTRVLNDTRIPTAISEAEAQAAGSAPYYKSLIENFNNYGSELQRIGALQTAANQRATIGADLDALNGPGGQLALAATDLVKQIDPEHFKLRTAVANGMLDNIASYNGGTATGADMAETERILNRYTSGQNRNSAIGTARAAMMVGQEAERRRQAFGEALARASSILPTMRSGIDPFGMATGRGGLTNQGAALFGSGIYGSTGQAGAAAGQQMFGSLNTINSTNQDILQKRGGLMDNILKGTQAFANIGKGVGGIMGGGMMG